VDLVLNLCPIIMREYPEECAFMVTNYGLRILNYVSENEEEGLAFVCYELDLCN